MSHFCRWEDDSLTLRIRVRPRASRDEIVGPHGDNPKVRITAPPVEGRANAHLVKYFAKAFGVPRVRVTLLAGESSRDKRLRIEAPMRLPAGIPAA